MRLFITELLLISFPILLYSQNNRCYTYDNAGNRVSRLICAASLLLNKKDTVDVFALFNNDISKDINVSQKKRNTELQH